MASYTDAIRFNPSDAQAWLFKGALHAFQAEGQEAKDHTLKALALSPLDPQLYFFQSLMASSFLAAEEYENALEMAAASQLTNGSHISTLRVIAIANLRLGRNDQARLAVKNLLQHDPSFTIKSYLERIPIGRFDLGKSFAEALRDAGVPEE